MTNKELDKLLSEAAELAARRMTENMVYDEAELDNIVFSERHEKQMEKMFAEFREKEQKKKNKNRIIKHIKKGTF
jgi:hypothetical protein